jgi:8-oxo-dGTP pyrophosphatase MutT (NUDIX family)
MTTRPWSAAQTDRRARPARPDDGAASGALPRAEPARAAVAVAAAFLLFALAWLALQHGFYREKQIRDTELYQLYGDRIADGRVPYRDFRVEYPPGALPAFALPSLAAGSGASFDEYRRWFEAFMVACGALVLLFTALTLRSLGRDPPAASATLLFVALAPLALGSVVLSRFDLWPAAIVAGALAALCAGRDRLAFGALGLGIAVKVYPVVLLPLFAARVWRRHGRRHALVATGVLAAVVAACVVPFALLGPDGIWASVVRQVTRPLQIESLGAAVLVAAHHVFGLDVTVRSSHGSQNLVGTGPEVLAVVHSVVQLAALGAIWLAFARGSADRERLVRLSAAAVCTFVALGKVASPQFLLWLVPLVALVRGRRGLAASGLLGAALVLTQLWFPYRYWELVFDLDVRASWLVLARDAVLIVLLGVLVRGDLRPSAVERALDADGWKTSDGQPVSRERPYGVAIVVRRAGDRGPDWLVLHRAHNGPDYEGDWAWGPPAGARLPGEAPDECARRELAEEAGLDLPCVRTRCGSRDWSVYTAEAPPDAEVTLSPEHDVYRWLPLEEAAGACLPASVGESLRAVAALAR